MKWTYRETLIKLLILGLCLAASKFIYLFLNAFNVLDILIFFGAGFWAGGKVMGGRWTWGLVLALPCMMLDLFTVFRLGYSNIASGIGTSYATALLLVPFSASLGVLIAVKRKATSDR